jgi:hypothetical protein
VGSRIQKSTTGVRVHDGVLSETILLLLGLGLLGLCLLWLCHGRNLYVIHYNRLGSLWVIVHPRWCWLWYRG